MSLNCSRKCRMICARWAGEDLGASQALTTGMRISVRDQFVQFPKEPGPKRVAKSV